MGKIIKVWIGVLLINSEGKILYGKRKSKHGENTYGPPGWHLEYGETIEFCAIRELREETSLIAEENDVHIYGILNEIYPNNEKHYINIITFIRNFSGEVKNLEPEKLEEWKWLSWEEIKNLWKQNFLPMRNFIKKYPDFDPLK